MKFLAIISLEKILITAFIYNYMQARLKKGRKDKLKIVTFKTFDIQYKVLHLSFASTESPRRLLRADKAVCKTGFAKQTIRNPSESVIHSLPVIKRRQFTNYSVIAKTDEGCTRKTSKYINIPSKYFSGTSFVSMQQQLSSSVAITLHFPQRHQSVLPAR